MSEEIDYNVIEEENCPVCYICRESIVALMSTRDMKFDNRPIVVADFRCPRCGTIFKTIMVFYDKVYPDIGRMRRAYLHQKFGSERVIKNAIKEMKMIQKRRKG